MRCLDSTSISGCNVIAIDSIRFCSSDHLFIGHSSSCCWWYGRTVAIICTGIGKYILNNWIEISMVGRMQFLMHFFLQGSSFFYYFISFNHFHLQWNYLSNDCMASFAEIELFHNLVYLVLLRCDSEYFLFIFTSFEKWSCNFVRIFLSD